MSVQDLRELWEQPARQLPITLRPAHRETTVSYVTRLATINHLDPIHLLEHIGRPRSRERLGYYRDITLSWAATRRLSIISGQPLRSLHRALPALAATTDAVPAPIVGRFTSGPYHEAHPACPRCVAHHQGGTVIAYLAPHRQLCIRHGRWLRGAQLDLTGLPEMGAAPSQALADQATRVGGCW